MNVCIIRGNFCGLFETTKPKKIWPIEYYPLYTYIAMYYVMHYFCNALLFKVTYHYILLVAVKLLYPCEVGPLTSSYFCSHLPDQ